jgi:hypothetical protein
MGFLFEFTAKDVWFVKIRARDVPADVKAAPGWTNLGIDWNVELPTHGRMASRMAVGWAGRE